ncbi:MAG: ABC transporter permease [Planctomycetes bacterium]|nr:ABC transporter permease [Planctomycetota bacterium]
MNVLGAILKDSFHEARDRRALFVLGGMACLAIAFCLGLSFREREESELLAHHVSRLGTFETYSSGGSSSSSVGFAPLLEATRRIVPEDGFDPALTGGWVVGFRVAGEDELGRLQKAWLEFRKRKAEDQMDPLRWVEQQLRLEGWQKLAVRRDPADAFRYEVGALCTRKERLSGAYSTSMFFGLLESDDVINRSREEFVLTVQLGLAGGLLGAIGIFVALLTSAGFVPSLLTKGTLDLALARPIGRTRLLLYKYLGGLWFIAITSAIVVGGTWAALALRTGVTDLRYLVMAPISIAIFAVLYAPLVLVGVITRSANVAGLAGLGVWWTSSMIVTFYDFSSGFAEYSAGVRGTMKVLYTVVPKTSHIADLGQRWLIEARLGGPDGVGRMLDDVQQFDWAFSLGTTVAFTVACLALACWRFRRTDY